MSLYASMSTVRGPAADVVETARLAGEAMLSWLHEFDGYRGLMVMADDKEGVAHVLTFWESAEAEERSRAGRVAMRDRLVSTTGYELVSTVPYAVPMLELTDGG